MALRKRCDLPCPFAGQERAHGIDQPPAGPHQRSTQCRATVPAARPADRAARASAATALRDCAATSRCPSKARRPAPGRPGRANRPAASSSFGGLSRRVSIRAPARSARGDSFDSRARLLSVARIVRAGSGRGQRQRLAAGPGAEIEDPLTVPRLAGQRDQLAALVLHLDQAVRDRPDDRRPGCRTGAGCPTG